MGITARLAASLERHERARELAVPWYATVWPADLNSLYATGTVTIDQPDTHGPKTGWAWDLYRVSVAGFTTGTVTLYRTAVQPQNTLLSWTQPGMYTLDKRQGLIMPGDRFVWQFTGVDNAYTAGAFVLIDITQLSDYLRC
jgi:hypothetical protein